MRECKIHHIERLSSIYTSCKRAASYTSDLRVTTKLEETTCISCLRVEEKKAEDRKWKCHFLIVKQWEGNKGKLEEYFRTTE